MTNAQAIQKVRDILLKRYPKYWNYANGERVLLAASVLANDIKVREIGNNSGAWVTAILNGTKLGPGYPWCAAAIEFCCDVAKVQWGPTDRNSAAVRNWYNKAKADGRLKTKPERGYLCLWLNSNGTGHIGVVANVLNTGKITSYEGNTSSGEAGSQRDGDGYYRRTRLKTVWEFYINLD